MYCLHYRRHLIIHIQFKQKLKTKNKINDLKKNSNCKENFTVTNYEIYKYMKKINKLNKAKRNKTYTCQSQNIV